MEEKNTMSLEQQKAEILKRWNRSSGAKITDMLLRYWNLKEENIIAEAKKIFAK
jgi:hypothetical protein